MFGHYCLQISALLIAIILHEMSHAAAALILGDDTALKAGRFKIYSHFDLFGSFLLPLFCYFSHVPFCLAYAKPVPINTMKFKDPLVDTALTAFAGPFCNLILGTLAASLLAHSNLYNSNFATLKEFALIFSIINFALFFFNLIPIPPFDGSRIIAYILPKKLLILYYRFEYFGIFIFFGLEMFLSFLSKLIGYDLSILHNFVYTPAENLMRLFIPDLY